VAALRRLDAAGTTISFDSLAREAGVSRSWLYAQADLRSEIERLRTRQQQSQPAGRVPPQRQHASDASLLRRLEAATDRIRRLEKENRALRDAVEQALGEQRTGAILGTTDRIDTPGKQRSKLIGPC
jgi:HAMP domain-containing protein